MISNNDNEKLIIQGFANISDAVIEPRLFTILIGEQASGKSIIAKLLHYFKSYLSGYRNAIRDSLQKRDYDRQFVDKFCESFPPSYWSHQSFKVSYIYKDQSLSIIREAGNKPKFITSSFFSSEYKKLRSLFIKKQSDSLSPNGPESDTWEIISEIADRLKSDSMIALGPNAVSNQHFIPAGRSFFSILEDNIFSFLSSNKQLDPYLISFGTFYESVKRFNQRSMQNKAPRGTAARYAAIDKRIESILRGEYSRKSNKDWITHPDGREVSVTHSSSGQQEALPLCLMLKTVTRSSGQNLQSFYIEEPEAHLFPKSQKSMIELISLVSSARSGKSGFFITTHSPYVLTAFNNLLLAGKIFNDANEEQTQKAEKVISKNLAINPEDLIAYSVKNGQVETMMCDETHLISASLIDAVSEELAEDFHALLTVES